MSRINEKIKSWENNKINKKEKRLLKRLNQHILLRQLRCFRRLKSRNSRLVRILSRKMSGRSWKQRCKKNNWNRTNKIRY